MQAPQSDREPSDDRTALAIVIVTYNSAEVLPGLLDSLACGLEGVVRSKVIVVDNRSQDRSVEIAQAHSSVDRVIQTGRNAGYAAGVNAATAEISTSMHLLVLNPDIRLAPGCLVILLKALGSLKNTGVVVPRMRNQHHLVSKSVRREPSITTAWSEALLGGSRAARMGLGEMVEDPVLYQKGGKIEWATGAILLISAGAREKVGDWDESFFLYSEEVDYLRRTREAGFDIFYVPQSEVVHIGGDYRSSNFLTNLTMANRIKYYRRHHGIVSTTLFQAALVAGECIRLLSRRPRTSALAAALGMWNGQNVAGP
ncbi:glycosyl transferase [Rhizobium sp. Leaf262]|nr:glycosyl transferase [Rhizobium sp. Leaf262]